MKQRPILFNSEMVNAILKGEKTETRRKRNLDFINDDINEWCLDHVTTRNENLFFAFKNKQGQYYLVKSPYGKIGDVLWVREIFAFTIGPYEPYDTYSYKADSFHIDVNRVGIDYPKEYMCKKGWYDECLASEVKWKPSIFMPKKATRIWLEIINIKIERLQEITNKDAHSEGVICLKNKEYKNYLKLGKGKELPKYWPTAYHSFQSLWESINGSENWELNPFVWVVKFKQIEKY